MNRTCAACGADLGGPYCGLCGAWNGDGPEPPRPDRVCPSCGAVNPPGNRHCQACAFHLDRAPLKEPGLSQGRRLAVLGAVVATLAVVVPFVANLIFDGSAVAEKASSSTDVTSKQAEAAVSTGPTLVEAGPVQPTSVSASSSFSESLGPENLVDGDPSSYWNDASLHGEGAELIFDFSIPVSIEQIVIQNVADESGFMRNYRIRGYEVTADGLGSPVVGELADTQDAQVISLATQGTTRLTLRITSTYDAAAVAGKPPFEELAVAEVIIMGRETDSG